MRDAEHHLARQEAQNANRIKDNQAKVQKVHDEGQTCVQRDLAKMRALGIIEGDQPEREIEEHKRK